MTAKHISPRVKEKLHLPSSKYETPHFTSLKFEKKTLDYPPQTFVTHHFTTLKLKAWTVQSVKTTFDCKKPKQTIDNVYQKNAYNFKRVKYILVSI